MQVLAIRIWQLQHKGQFPERLEALVPVVLPSLPIDPYSGQPFGFRRSHGLDVPRLRESLTAAPRKGQPAEQGSCLLYSVGPDGRDDRGITFKSNDPQSQPMDIVFAIPPIQINDPGASKRPDHGQDAAKDRPAPKP